MWARFDHSSLPYRLSPKSWPTVDEVAEVTEARFGEIKLPLRVDTTFTLRPFDERTTRPPSSWKDYQRPYSPRKRATPQPIQPPPPTPSEPRRKPAPRPPQPIQPSYHYATPEEVAYIDGVVAAHQRMGLSDSDVYALIGVRHVGARLVVSQDWGFAGTEILKGDPPTE